MNLQKFSDIYNLAKQRINYTDVDDIVDSVIKSGINQAYMLIAKDEEPLIMKKVITIKDGMLKLPGEVMDVIDISPSILAPKRMGNVILTSSTGDVTVTYSYVPDPLAYDNDVPEISSKYWYLLSTYGCYAYYLFKKRENEAAAYLAEYSSTLPLFRQKRKYTAGRKSAFANYLEG